MDKSDRLEVYLTEYKALRDETTTKIRDRQHITNYSLMIFTGALVFVSSKAFITNGQFFPLEEPWRVGFFLFLPLVSLSMGFIRLRQDLLLAYIAQATENRIAPKIHRLLGKPNDRVFEWEDYLEKKRTPEKLEKFGASYLLQLFLSAARYFPCLVLTTTPLLIASFKGEMSKLWMKAVFWLDWALLALLISSILLKLLPETEGIPHEY